MGYGVLERSELLQTCDIVISLKPNDEWETMNPGSILVGWLNHLSGSLPKHISLLELEDVTVMAEGREQKLLWKNAQVAGECGVAQTFAQLPSLEPDSPAIAQKKLAVILGYGNLGMGAAKELHRQGVERIIVFTQRHPRDVKNRLPGVEYRQMEYNATQILGIDREGIKTPLIDTILPEADIIVNAKKPSFQCPKWVFIPQDKFRKLKQNMVFIDPVHLKNHGADFIEVTPLSNPLKKIERDNHGIWFNGCNAMPSFNAAYASSIISQAFLKDFDRIMAALEDRGLLGKILERQSSVTP